MVRFVAIAPVVKITNMESPAILGIRKNAALVQILKGFGPEVLSLASMESPMNKAFLKTALGSLAPQKVMQVLSDSDTSLISEQA